MIRQLQESDWEHWKPLWDDYLDFYRTKLEPETTKTTFERLCAGTNGMLGLLGLDVRGTPKGFAHIVMHPATWTTTSYCYLEDLFVARQARGSGLSQELIFSVYEEAERAQSTRVYWHTQEFNAPARSLYDEVGRRTSFIMYER